MRVLVVGQPFPFNHPEVVKYAADTHPYYPDEPSLSDMEQGDFMQQNQSLGPLNPQLALQNEISLPAGDVNNSAQKPNQEGKDGLKEFFSVFPQFASQAQANQDKQSLASVNAFNGPAEVNTASVSKPVPKKAKKASKRRAPRRASKEVATDSSSPLGSMVATPSRRPGMEQGIARQTLQAMTTSTPQVTSEARMVSSAASDTIVVAAPPRPIKFKIIQSSKRAASGASDLEKSADATAKKRKTEKK